MSTKQKQRKYSEEGDTQLINQIKITAKMSLELTIESGSTFFYRRSQIIHLEQFRAWNAFFFLCKHKVTFKFQTPLHHFTFFCMSQNLKKNKINGSDEFGLMGDLILNSGQPASIRTQCNLIFFSGKISRPTQSN